MTDDTDILLEDLSIDLSDVKLLDEGEYVMAIVGLKKDQTKPSDKNPDGFPVLVVTFNAEHDDEGRIIGRKHFQRFPMEGPQAFATLKLLTCLGLARADDDKVVLRGSDLLGKRMRVGVTHRTDDKDRTFAEIRRFIELLN